MTLIKAMRDSDLKPTSADQQIDVTMQAMLDRYLPRRKPVSVDDYDWDRIKPGAVDPGFLEALGFVTLVESNPEAPAQMLIAAGEHGNAPWLCRFIRQTWLPEELMHHAPYREYLVRLGVYSATEIDSLINDVRDRGFIYGKEYTPLQAATYGWLQELITWHFYEAMISYLLTNSENGSRSDPVLIRMLRDIAKQENFHRYIYLSGAQTVLKYSPDRKGEVINTVGEFLMPGHHMVPDMQHRAPEWAFKFNFPFRRLLRDISAGLVELTGYKGLGRTAVLYGVRHEVPIYMKAVIMLLNPLSKPYHSPVNYATGRLLAAL